MNREAVELGVEVMKDGSIALTDPVDRRVLERKVPRLELSIVRCDVPGREPVPGCCASQLGLPWWKVPSRRPRARPGR